MNEYEIGLRYDEIFMERIKSNNGAGGAVCRDLEREAAIILAKETASLEKEEIKEWLINEDFEGLAERI